MDSNLNEHKNKIFHLIDDECKLNEGFSHFLEQAGFGNCQNDYQIISIIGSQNSGKSTLLNVVFDTSFEVLNVIKKQQTTKGIWVQKDKEKNIMILDVEGSNSRQRGKQEKGAGFYEKSTGLFALAFSQVLILNINCSDLGHNTWYDLMKEIMEMMLRLFKNDQKKQILIVCRNYNDKKDDLEVYQEDIKNEIKDIWKDINKPKEFQNVEYESVFQLSFHKCADYSLDGTKQQAEQDMRDLREMFVNKQNPKYIFREYDESANIPINAVENYVGIIWDTIKNNKDLHLPNSKIQAAQIRCLQIKDQSLELVKKELDQLQQETNVGIADVFGQRAVGIEIQATKFYDEQSQYYFPQVRESMRQTLLNELFAKLKDLFNKQITQLQNKYKKDIQDEIKPLTYTRNNFQAIMEALKDIHGRYFNKIFSFLNNSIPHKELNEEWEMNKHQRSFEDNLNQLISNKKDLILIQYINKILDDIKQQVYKEVDNLFNNELDLNFWNNLQALYSSYREKINNQMKQELEGNYPDEVVGKETNSLQNQLFANYKENIMGNRMNLNAFLLKKFKKVFTTDEKGQIRQWQKSNIEQIQSLHKSAFEAVVPLIEIFQRFQLFENNVKLTETDQEQFLHYNQLQTVKNNFEKDTTEQLEEAIRKYEDSQGKGIPKWMWALLAFFMYDDVLRWLGNPIFLYPILLVLSFIGMCISTGYGYVPKLLAASFFDLIKGKVGSTMLNFR